MALQKAKWMKCVGEAHSNPHIDHCMVCVPYWGEYPVCPHCGRKISKVGKKRVKCISCDNFVDITRPPAVAPPPPPLFVKKPDPPIVESKLDYGSRVALQIAIRDLQMACAKIGTALESKNKFTEWNALKEAHEAVKRAGDPITNVLFSYVGK